MTSKENKQENISLEEMDEMRKTHLHRSEGRRNIRRTFKLFDSAEWVMKGSKDSKTSRSLGDLPSPTDDCVKEYLDLVKITHTQSSLLI